MIEFDLVNASRRLILSKIARLPDLSIVQVPNQFYIEKKRYITEYGVKNDVNTSPKSTLMEINV